MGMTTPERDIESGPENIQESEAQETSSFLGRFTSHHLDSTDQRNLLIGGGSTMAGSGVLGGLMGLLQTGLPANALFYSLAYMGVAFAAMALGVGTYVGHGQCAEPADPARQPILPPRPR